MEAAGNHTTSKALRTTQVGIVISIILVFLKAISGHLGHSYALIADATETGADVFSSGLLLLALRLAVKPADKQHPYGHGKAEPIAAVMISIFLIGAAFWIGFHAIEMIQTPHELPKRFTLAVLMIVMVIKEIMFRYVRAVGRQLKSNAVIADAYHHRSDAITSVAAFIGISVALIMGKGHESADDWAALLASGVIIFNAIGILRPALGEIMDAAPSEEIVEQVRELAASVQDVRMIEKTFVRKMGFDYFVDLHVQVDPDMTVQRGHEIAHQVKDLLLHSDMNIKDVLIHIEPYDGR
ncbi:cation diffusion facilitator family transporter [Mucilaginibacter yixingensis]|uniref:Cation diffusion facilitator family transporter n=1 Tax=Mucilaginibacter yixingensis TaxID=1295612 RepID=A0A2T5JB77_9SPHI|nr:cation diffusion facilitator family transporter [Mucilaginibacter yixingensis]PTQ98126.1 cation diffusion facilitator family transporter [Mucilaginibacter yixingensis]